MIYGTPAVTIDNDSTDKIGLRTLVLSQMWQGSRSGMSIADLDAEEPAPPAVSTGVILVGRQRRRNGGALRTSWTFEGIAGNGKDVTFKTRYNTLDYQFDPGFAQVNLQLHPALQDLLDKYGGTIDPGGSNEIIWPSTLSGEGTASGLSGGSSGSSSKTNPMYGHQDFLQLEGTYSCRYGSFDLGTVESGVGKIFTSGLPGSPPAFSDRNWLKAPATYRRCGPIYEITEIYWLSGPGGWPEAIYGLASGGGSQGSGIDGATGNYNFSVFNASSLAL